MTSRISFAGIILPVPTPEIEDYVEASISLRDVMESAEQSITVDNAHWNRSGYRLDDRITVNRLAWPVGASRWAMFHSFIHGDDLPKLRRKKGPQELLIHGVTFEGMYALQPRPLFHGELYLLTVVDSRYFWPNRTAVIAPQATWAALYAAIGTAIGETITHAAISSAYLLPPADFASTHDLLSVLLDAVAASVGQRIVMHRDGTVEAMGPVESLAAAKSNRNYGLRAGGRVERPDASLNLPGTFRMVFPKSAAGVVEGDVYTSDYVPAGTVRRDLGGLLSSDVVTMQSTAIAYYDTSLALQNGTELDTLADTLGAAWYSWRFAPYEMNIGGCFEWEMEGMHDLAWSVRDAQATTRVTMLPAECTDRTGHRSATYHDISYAWDGDAIKRSLTLHGHYLTPPSDTTATTTLATANQTLLRITTAGTIHGLDNPIDGKRVRLWNVTSGAITLKHLGGSASTQNQVMSSSGADIPIAAGESIDLDYHLDDSKWRASFIAGGGSTTFTSITATTVISTIITSTTVISTIVNTGDIYVSGNATFANATYSGNVTFTDPSLNVYVLGEITPLAPYVYLQLDGSNGDGSYWGTMLTPEPYTNWFTNTGVAVDIIKEVNQNPDLFTTGATVGNWHVAYAGDVLPTDIDLVVSRVGGGTTNSEQTLTYQAASGTFGLSFLGQTTANIPIGSTAATVKSAIEALSNVTQNVNVTKSGAKYVIEFVDDASPDDDTIFDTPGVAFFVGFTAQTQEFYIESCCGGDGGGPFDYIDWINQNPTPGQPAAARGRLYWDNNYNGFAYVNDVGNIFYLVATNNLPSNGQTPVYNSSLLSYDPT